MEKVVIEGVELQLTQPDDVPMTWVGQEELVTQVLAAWMVVGDDDLPLSPRLVGKPGVGKTTLAYHAGRILKRPVYLFQATMDTRPEDLIVTPVISIDIVLKTLPNLIALLAITFQYLTHLDSHRGCLKLQASHLRQRNF